MRTALLLVTALVACTDAPELGETQLGLNVVNAFGTTVLDGSAVKTLELQCPPGYVGTQVSFLGMTAPPQQLVTDLVGATYPNATGDRWRVVARDLAAHPGWRLEAHLACIEPGGSYELVSGSVSRDPRAAMELELACPAGKVVLGAAFSPNERFRNGPAARATYSMPAADGSSWRIRGRGLTKDAWTLAATIVCYDALDLSGYQIVTSTEPPLPGPFAHTFARCPSIDFGVTGGGWSVRDIGGTLLEGTAYFDQRWPAHGHPLQFPGGWETQVYLFSGFSKTVQAEGATICI